LAQKHNMFSLEGRLINNTGEKRARVEINTESGVIEKITESIGTADLMLQDELIFPGFGDVHVHAREDASGKQSYKEDFQTVGKAALHGGVCFIAEMPNNPIAPVNQDTYREKQRLAKTSPISVLLYAGIGPNTKPLSLPVPYKVFMGPSVGNLFFTNFAELERVIAQYEGQAISFHCEDPKILTETSRPPAAEISAIEFALYVIEKYNVQGKVCHCSTQQGIEKIAQAKQRGVQVTCEVTPHHLYFDESMITDENRKWLQVNPPIRNREDRLALISALREGVIDYLATDHAPHTKEEKERGLSAGEAGISGMPHLDTYGAFTIWLMKEHNFTPQDIARVCSYNPGQFVHKFLSEKYGSIQEGFMGSLTIIDSNTPSIIRKDNLETKCGWSPFEGVEFPGQVLYTIHKGKIAYAKNSSHN
jgi:dihydroorotase